MIATPMGNNGTLPKIHSPTAHVYRAAAVFNSRCVRRGIRDVPTARLCPRCANNSYHSADSDQDADDSPDDNFNERGNMDANFIQIVDPNEKPITYTLTVSHNDLDIPYIYLNTNQHDSSGTQPDADAPVKRSERGGHSANDKNT